LNWEFSASSVNQPAALQWTWTYSPSEVLWIAATPGPSAESAGKALVCSATPGSLTCILSGLNNNPVSPGIVARATVMLAPSLTVGTTISVTNTLGASPAGEFVAVSGSGSSVSLRPVTGGTRSLSQIGVFRPIAVAPNSPMAFFLDQGGSYTWDSNAKIRFFGLSGAPGATAPDIPVIGDWDGSGISRLGVFRCPAVGQPGPCSWYIDLNNSGQWEGTLNGDAIWANFGLPGDIPVVGDWNGTGVSKIGVFRCPSGTGECQWVLDLGNKHTYDPATAGIYRFGLPGDQPVVGTWTANSPADQVGILRCPTAGAVCQWIVDSLGKTGGSSVSLYDPADAIFPFTGPGGFVPGDVAVVGDWNGNGRKRIGIFRPVTGTWFVDTNGNGSYEAPPFGVDQTFSFGLPAVLNPGGVADQPVVGFWTLPGLLLLP
jgi:hypothetical protein